MKDQDKAKYRVHTLKIIEQLDTQVQHLRMGEISMLRKQPGGPHTFDHESNQEGYLWEYMWQLNPIDADNKMFMKTLDEICSIINSRDALRKYPRGMYRMLVEFSDKCEKKKNWMEPRTGYLTNYEESSPSNKDAYEDAKRSLQTMVDAFRDEIKTIIRTIYFFEDERDENDESFIE